MEYSEYCDLADQLVAQLQPRVSEDHRDELEPARWGGEYGYLVEELVHTVVAEQVPLSAEELANLRALAAETWESAKLLALLEQARPN